VAVLSGVGYNANKNVNMIAEMTVNHFKDVKMPFRFGNY